MLLRRNDLVSTRLIMTGVWDEHIVKVADRMPADRRRLALDVGAHFGAISLSLRKRFRQVASFEPNEFSFSILSANMALNRVDNVTLYSHGLFSSPADLSLGRPEQQEIPVPVDESGRFNPLCTPNIAAYVFTPDGSGEFLKRAKALDSLLLEEVDFIKIDVQGADGEVLLGGVETLRRCRPVVVFEWEEALSKNFGVTFQSLKQTFYREGYKLELLHQHNDRQSDFIAFPV